MRRLSAILSVFCVAAHAAPAAGQYSHPLLLELARDPGRSDVPRTAKALALGGASLGSGTADDAVANPGSLMLGTGTDVIASYGSSFYQRQELVNTPKQLPPFDPARRVSPRSTAPVGFAAVATRGSRWAAAGFYDATSRYAHTFATDKAQLFFTALFPTVLSEKGSGAASIAQSSTRIGGAFAAGSRNARVGVGVSAYLVRMNYIAEATDTIEVGSSGFATPVFTTTCCMIDRDRVDLHGWGSGLAVSAIVTPVRHLTLGARWHHEPTFDTIRQWSSSGLGARPPLGFDAPVQFRLPGSYGVSAIVTGGSTTILAELSREMYGGAFLPLTPSTFDPNYNCGQIKYPYPSCPGWGFAYHDTRDTTTVKGAIEQVLAAGRNEIALRAGIAYEPGYTLARLATDVSTRRTLELPAPPIVTEFEPPRESATWLSAGVAYRMRAAEIGVGVGRASNQTRLLVDLRLRPR